MRKIPPVILLIITLGFLIGMSVYITKSKESASLSTPIIETIKEDSKEKHYVIDIQYPNIVGVSDKAKGNKLNSVIKTKMDTLIANFKKEVSGLDTAGLPQAIIESNLTVRSQTALATNRYVSIEFSISDMTAGQAHPTNYTDTFNYDIEKEKEMKISDVFTPDSNYIAELSKISTADLLAQNKKLQFTDPEWIKKGAGPKSENFQKFLLTKDSLVVVFDVYQVASYASGVQKATIPYNTISKMLNLTL